MIPGLEVGTGGSVRAAGSGEVGTVSARIPEQLAKASAAALGEIRPAAVMLGKLQLGDVRMAALLAGLGESVRSIDLTRNILTPSSMPALSHLVGLRSLVMCDNAGLAMDDGAALAGAMVALAGLRTFDISGCRLSPAASAAICGALTTMWGSADSSAGLQLRLGFCGIGDAGGEALGRLLAKGCGISELSLRGSSLGEAGTRALAAGIGGAG